MKKAIKKKIGAALAIVGIGLAVCTADECQYELWFRFVGAAAFAVGAYMGEAYDFQNKKENERLERREDHEPYPEEFHMRPVGEIQEQIQL